MENAFKHIGVRLPSEVYDALEQYRARNGLRSLAAAIIHMIRKASEPGEA